MQAKASIIKLETRKGKQSGKEFTVVDLAENFGQGEDRETTYYKGLVFTEAIRAVLKKGQFVEFTGQATPRVYTKQDGTAAAEISVRIFKLDVLKQPREDSAGQSGAAKPAANAPANAPANAAPANQGHSDDEALYDRHSAMADAYEGM